MSQAYGGAPAAPRSSATTEVSGWAVGWTAFAGVMMAIQGAWWFIAGLVALIDDEFYVVTQEWIFQFDLTTWGWIHLVVGVVLFVAGLSLFTGAVWARTVGVLMAAVATLIAFAWLPYYPLWAILFIVGSISVIWALTAHGRDIAQVE